VSTTRFFATLRIITAEVLGVLNRLFRFGGAKQANKLFV
jgi:hypothetical protein